MTAKDIGSFTCLYEGGVGGGEFETELTRREKEKSEDGKEMKWC